MTDPRRAFGDAGETLAASFLARAGFSILDRQVRTPFGEIDLVCEDGDELVFAEVKTRQSDEFGYPEEAITPAKFRHMVASAEAFLAARGWENRLWRIDVLAIRVLSGADPEIVHLKAVDGPHGT
ncbi:YraN family protein [bacterium]|nr:YraN family protein [bacterium]